MKKTVFTLTAIILLSSCVSQKKYNEVVQSNSQNGQRLTECGRKNAELTNDIAALQQDIKKKNQTIEDLTKGDKKSSDLIKSLNKENEDLKQQLSAANKKVNEILNDKSEHLTFLSNTLYNREQELNAKELTLDSLQNEFYENQNQMKALKSQLAGKEAQLKKIQKTLKDALLGFADKGLTIEQKNGKVYVLMEEKLLFESGKWTVSNEGKNALKEIAEVLAKNSDINVMVEGHTDNVPLSSKNQIKDNWDLSVMRATSITKILLTNKNISPNRIIPCGRGEYSPVANNNTVENRAKNRRTEIILSPKVNKLMDIIK